MSESLTVTAHMFDGETNGDTSDPRDWDHWVRHLQRRSGPIGLRSAIKPGGRAALRWGLTDRHEVSTAWSILQTLENVARKREASDSAVAMELESWLQGLPRRAVSRSLGLECVAWSYALVDLSRELPAAPWCELLDQLIAVSTDTELLSTTDDLLAQQWLAGELPFSLACLLPEVKPCRALHLGASATLSSAIIDWLDGEGLIHGDALSNLRPLLACWTRCQRLAQANGVDCLNTDAREQYAWLIQQTLRLTRRDGSQMFETADANRGWRNLFHAALALSGDPEDRAVARHVLPGWRKSSKADSNGALPEPSVFSEWSGIAVMRGSWSRGATEIGVTFNDQTVVAELSRLNQQVFSGAWNLEVVVDGLPRDVEGRWSELCWFSDNDVVYLELEAPLGNGIVLQRQVLIARDDHFLWLGHVVLGKKSADIRLTVTWPFHEDVHIQPADETREATIVRGGTPCFLVMPLALPEWRAEPSDGELTTDQRGLVLEQRSVASRLDAPLFFDLSPKRRPKPYTWRRLTVAEDLEVQPQDVATGYRVQIGRRQWLFYRSLAAKRVRTVLGQNLGCDYLCGRFRRDGSLDTLIEIE
ncbi:MAG: hypothetical protein CMJ59_00945 [Planctomycetaceae bacterium]|nr:hypothetical protein [Planctomycetaceae bacterium]